MSKKGILAIISICIAAIAAIVLAVMLHSTSGKLKQTQAELAATNTTLQRTETAKADLEKKLTETQSALKETRSELSQTQEILQNESEAARKIAAERNALQQDKGALEREKEGLRAKLTEIESELQRIRTQSQRSIVAIQEKFKDTVGAVLDDAGRLRLDVKGKILFETGSAILSTEGKALLDAIAEDVLLNTNYADYAVRVEGTYRQYTDRGFRTPKLEPLNRTGNRCREVFTGACGGRCPTLGGDRIRFLPTDRYCRHTRSESQESQNRNYTRATPRFLIRTADIPPKGDGIY